MICDSDFWILAGCASTSKPATAASGVSNIPTKTVGAQCNVAWPVGVGVGGGGGEGVRGWGGGWRVGGDTLFGVIMRMACCVAVSVRQSFQYR